MPADFVRQGWTGETILSQKRIRLVPNAAQNFPGWFRAGKRGGLSRPCLYPAPVLHFLGLLAQRQGEAALDGIGSRRGRVLMKSGLDIGIFYATAEPSAIGAGQNGGIGFRAYQSTGPGGVQLRSAQEAGANRCGGRAERQSRGNAAPVHYAA